MEYKIAMENYKSHKTKVVSMYQVSNKEESELEL